MEIDGIIIEVLKEENGVSKSSGKEWRKQAAILETSETYPRKVAFSMFNNNIMPLEIGKKYRISFNLESREFNGKWYTDVQAWKVEPLLQGQTPYQGNTLPPQPAEPQQPNSTLGDELPF